MVKLSHFTQFIDVPLSVDDAWETVLATTKAVAVKVRSADDKRHVCVVTTKATGAFLENQALGHVLTVSVAAVGPGRTRITVDGASKGVFGGKSRGSVDPARRTQEAVINMLNEFEREAAWRIPGRTAPVVAERDATARLRELNDLLTSGLITQEEFATQKKSILQTL